MTDTTPTPPADNAPDSAADLTPPPEVQALLDEASVEGGPNSAQFTQSSVLLVNSRTRELVREVQWAEAGAFGTNLLNAILNGRTETEVRADLKLPTS